MGDAQTFSGSQPRRPKSRCVLCPIFPLQETFVSYKKFLLVSRSLIGKLHASFFRQFHLLNAQFRCLPNNSLLHITAAKGRHYLHY